MKADLVQYMGSDLTVVNAARVSFDKQSTWDESWKETNDGLTYLAFDLKESDERLISYLARHGHWTPFAHTSITLRETVPIFVARQRFKHTVGFVYNEVSRRYVSDLPEFYTPDVWRGKPVNAKQGSSDEVITEIDLGEGTALISNQYRMHLQKSQGLYEDLVRSGVAPEQARMVLPQSMYTSYYVTGSLAAFARAYKQRIDPHAQVEIQDLAKRWNELIEPLFPVSWKALTSG